jgi:hypothetical protein
MLKLYYTGCPWNGDAWESSLDRRPAGVYK